MKSLASIREYKPSRLYIAADGARSGRPQEVELCENTRQSVKNAVDWDCELKLLFREENLGCTKAVSSAVDWFFSCEEYGVIIEDDCLIHPDFFTLCETLLPHYRDEEHVMLITAQNHTPDIAHSDRIVFTNVALIWGWASWRRAWAKMDMKMTAWRQYKYKFAKILKNFGFLYGLYMYVYWLRDFRAAKHGSWDTRWFFSVFSNNGICVSPNVCLSQNLGIETGGEHYEAGGTNHYAHVPFGSVKFPVILPEKLEFTRQKLLAERREFRRIRKIGLKTKIKRLLHL